MTIYLSLSFPTWMTLIVYILIVSEHTHRSLLPLLFILLMTLLSPPFQFWCFHFHYNIYGTSDSAIIPVTMPSSCYHHCLNIFCAIQTSSPLPSSFSPYHSTVYILICLQYYIHSHSNYSISALSPMLISPLSPCPSYHPSLLLNDKPLYPLYHTSTYTSISVYISNLLSPLLSFSRIFFKTDLSPPTGHI